MSRTTFFILVLMAALIGVGNVQASGRLAGVDENIKERVIEINSIMVSKDRDESLKAINELADTLRTTKKEWEYSVLQNVERIEFFISKYDWVKARRILKDLMTDMNLEYQPTYE